MKRYQMLIGGEWVDAEARETFETENPYLGAAWAFVPRAKSADVDRAVESAWKAFRAPSWAKISATARGALLRKLADLIAAEADRLAEIETRDNGKLITEMRTQLRYIPQWFNYFGGLADKIEGRVIPIDKPGMIGQIFDLGARLCHGEQVTAERHALCPQYVGIRNLPYAYVLIKGQGEVILVDTGYDHKEYGKYLADLYGVSNWHPASEVLAECGVTPADVTTVFITHAHFDHMGGLDLFPNAKFYIQKRELDQWVWALTLGPEFRFLVGAADPADIVKATRLAREGRMIVVDGDRDDVLARHRPPSRRGHAHLSARCT